MTPFDPEKKSNRCTICLLPKDLCFCSELRKLDTTTRVVLLMHAQERDKPSNTGRLALLSLKNSEVRYRGLKEGPPLSYEGLLDDQYETWILRLSPDAEEIGSAIKKKNKPIRLLVPDGTWAQASRAGTKVAKELKIKSVYLSEGPPSEYRLRTEHHPLGLGTIEAIARAMGVLENLDTQNELERVMILLRNRVLFTRGKISQIEFGDKIWKS